MKNRKLKIGIDISQTAYEGTGVGEMVSSLVEELLKVDKENEYILFFSSLRKKITNYKFQISNEYQIRNSKIQIKIFRFPPTVLDFLWNKLHIFPIEWFIGNVDVFISSDWTQPPTLKAKKATILYDLIIYKYPEETDSKIVEVQKRKLGWVKKECDIVFCISEATKRDAMELLGIEEEKLKVIYPGI